MLGKTIEGLAARLSRVFPAKRPRAAACPDLRFPLSALCFLLSSLTALPKSLLRESGRPAAKQKCKKSQFDLAEVRD